MRSRALYNCQYSRRDTGPSEPRDVSLKLKLKLNVGGGTTEGTTVWHHRGHHSVVADGSSFFKLPNTKYDLDPFCTKYT